MGRDEDTVKVEQPSRLKDNSIYRSRERQKASQVGGCEQCSGSGRIVDFGETADGLVKEEDRICSECGGEGRGVFCAICEKTSFDPDEELDFHHWDYEKNVGVFVCRKCHNGIHSTPESYAENSDNWVTHAFSNALQMMREEGTLDNLGEEEVLTRLNIKHTVEDE